MSRSMARYEVPTVKLRPLLLSAIGTIALCLPAFSQSDGPADEVVLQRFEVAPVIDGDLSDAVWEGAPALENWTIPLTTQAAPKACAVRVGFGDAGIYIGARFAEPDTAGLQTLAADGGADVWKDDAIEIWVRTSDSNLAYDQFIVNAAGARQQVRGRPGGSENPAPQFPAAASIGEDHWSLEVRIPWTEIGLERVPDPGDMIQLKFGREDPQGRETVLLHWPPRAAYGAAEGYGRAYFVTNNLLPNADFAVDADGNPEGWGLHELVVGRISVVEDQGRSALRWETPGSYATMQRSIQLEPNGLYRLEGWTRGDAAISLRARTRRTADQETTDAYSVTSEPSEDYVYHSVTFPTGEDGSALIILGATETTGVGTVYISGLTVAREAVAEAAGPAVPLVPGATQRITDIAPAECKSLRGFVGGPMDGRLDTVSWNGSTWEYGARNAGSGVYYEFADGDGLNIRLADAEGVDAVQLRGGAKVQLYRDATSYYEPGEGDLVWDWASNAQSSRAVFGERAETDRFSFFNLKDGFISDLYFFRLGEETPLPEPTVLSAQAPIELPEDLAAAATQFGSEAGAIHRLDMTKMAVQIRPEVDTWTHLMTAPVPEDTGLLAVGLRLNMPDAPIGLPLEVAVMDPFSPEHRVISAELTAEGAGVVHVVLDHLDQVVPAGRRVWVALRTGAPVTLETPQVELYYAPVSDALAEAVDYRLWIVRTMFASLSEPRPWMNLRSRDADMAEFAQTAYAGPKVVKLLEEAAFAKQLAPEHPIVQQYDQWLWQRAGLPEFEPTIDEVPGAPEWAVVLRQAYLEAREVPRWWVENRLVPTGEFGGSVGDDTDMYQNYTIFPMISDEPLTEVLREGAEALAELAEATRMEEGLNKHTTDPLHAYEEGVNHEALMAWWNYGDPVYFERCLAAARSMPATTTVTERGHRHFKSQLIGSEDLRVDRELGEDGDYSALMLHPLFKVLWYNRHPQVEQFLREWADSWLDHQQPGDYAFRVDVATEEATQTYEARPLYGGGMASSFYSMVDHLGDEKYARPFMDMFSQGVASLRIADFLPEFYQLGLLDDLDAATLQALEQSEPYLPVLTRGDRSALLDALRKDIAEMQRFKYMYTEAGQFTDRIFLYAVQNAAKAYCGAYVTRNKISNGISASWEGFGTDFAALVLAAGDDRLKAAVYSFADEPMEGGLRVWQLENGRYRVTIGPDADGDDALDAPAEALETELTRYSRVPVTLQPRQVTIIEIEQIEPLAPIYERPDLALSPLDTVVANGTVRGVAHNIGQSVAGPTTIALVSAGGEVVASQALVSLPGIRSDLQPVRVEFELAGVPANVEGWQVVIDRGGSIDEIYEGNNTLRLQECVR